jgi:hypothetical protein
VIGLRVVLVSLHLSPATALLSLVIGFRYRGLNSANFKTALPTGRIQKAKTMLWHGMRTNGRGQKGRTGPFHPPRWRPSFTEPNNPSHHLKPKPYLPSALLALPKSRFRKKMALLQILLPERLVMPGSKPNLPLTPNPTARDSDVDVATCQCHTEI